jgi:hypothetical protein
MSSSIYSAAGRLGAHRKWSRVVDRSRATEPARAGFEARFERLARKAAAEQGIHDPSPEQVRLMASAARSAHFVAMRMRRGKAGR